MLLSRLEQLLQSDFGIRRVEALLQPFSRVAALRFVDSVVNVHSVTVDLLERLRDRSRSVHSSAAYAEESARS